MFTKRILSLIMSVCLIFSLSSVNANALEKENVIYNYDDAYEAISAELSSFASCKNLIDLDNVDFTSLYIAEGVNVYEYCETGFVKIAMLYPVLEKNKIVTVSYTDDGEMYQFMTGLGTVIQNTGCNTGFAIVYDIDGCHLFDGNNFTLLLSSDNKIVSRKSVSKATNTEKNMLRTASLNTKRALSIEPLSPSARGASDYKYCNVKYVTENPDKKICWAASIAMISNCVKGTSLTAQNVAKRYYIGESNYDDYVEPTLIPDVMNSVYGLNYSLHRSQASDGVISSNINNGTPLYATFNLKEITGGTDRANLACVIYWINIIAGIIIVMDPRNGSVACHLSNSKYILIRPDNGAKYTYSWTICRSW